MDFREEKPVGRDIEEDYQALKFGGGYDHNWALNGSGFRKVASLSCEKSGISMEVYTDLPGMQLYCGNFLEGDAGKGGCAYGKRSGVCFETQYFPDAVHKEDFAVPWCGRGRHTTQSPAINLHPADKIYKIISKSSHFLFLNMIE